MSVASHLAVSPAKYDARIRSLIPLYDELIVEVARALGHAARPVRIVVDLGIGTGALARACLERASGARVWGIDTDPDMMAVARTRLGRLSRRAMMTTGNFLDQALPSCDAIVASYSLHHIRTARAKLAFYRRCYRALRPGGVLINGDCAPASTPRGFARDLDVWFTHLGKTFGSRARGRRVYESWADEDMYLALAEEIRLMERAGFGVDVPWRRSPSSSAAAELRPENLIDAWDSGEKWQELTLFPGHGGLVILSREILGFNPHRSRFDDPQIESGAVTTAEVTQHDVTLFRALDPAEKRRKLKRPRNG